jgi:prefoldin subunit 5
MTLWRSHSIARGALLENSDINDLIERLRQCEAEIARLRSENDALRQSSRAFGDLAERLNKALRIANRGSEVHSASG